MTTVLFNKPFGVLSKFSGSGDQITLKKYIPVPGVYAAGRLDKNSEGLMILTDVGALVQRISSPNAKLPKTYLAQVEGIAVEEQIQPLRSGLEIQGYRTLPADVQIVPEPKLAPRPVPVRDYHPTSWLKVILREGKNRQVRRMTAAVGLPTLRLVRIAIGTITLEGLSPGEWRYITSEELGFLSHTLDNNKPLSKSKRWG